MHVDRGLSRNQRIVRTWMFRETFEQGLRYAGRHMVLWLRRVDGAAMRVGVVAAKKSFRKAAERARAKRLMRESFRLNRWRLGTGSYDVVLVARRSILEVKRQAVDEDLLSLAGRAGILAQTGKAAGG